MRARRERAYVRVDPCDPSPEFLRSCFAELFASLDGRPRPLDVEVFAQYESGARASVDLAEGDPVFAVDGAGLAPADFRRRWIAEHPVPLDLSRRASVRLLMEPASGNRVKVRLRRAWRIPGFRARRVEESA